MTVAYMRDPCRDKLGQSTKGYDPIRLKETFYARHVWQGSLNH